MDKYKSFEKKLVLELKISFLMSTRHSLKYDN